MELPISCGHARVKDKTQGSKELPSSFLLFVLGRRSADSSYLSLLLQLRPSTSSSSPPFLGSCLPSCPPLLVSCLSSCPPSSPHPHALPSDLSAFLIRSLLLPLFSLPSLLSFYFSTSSLSPASTSTRQRTPAVDTPCVSSQSERIEHQTGDKSRAEEGEEGREERGEGGGGEQSEEC